MTPSRSLCLDRAMDRISVHCDPSLSLLAIPGRMSDIRKPPLAVAGFPQLESRRYRLCVFCGCSQG
jgi:hypothetical protein